jgi:L,D-peptidoglycan transpeptidase YkuD (ErfK/YbiS/YcfS/YnhG family)
VTVDVIRVRRAGDAFEAEWGMGWRRCAVGFGGIGEKLREGDGITPAGRWPLRRVLYRADRLSPPPSALPATAIAPEDGWCDAPGDPNYNRLVKLPYRASAEHMWRQDALYDLVVVVGFNDRPVQSGKGSAIFLHLARADYGTTEGCVAFARADLLEAISVLSRDAVVEIQS